MTDRPKRNWFLRGLKYLAGLSPTYCYSCRIKLANQGTECPNCGLSGSKLRSPYVPARIMLMSGAFLLVSGLVVYGLEILLEPYTRQYYIDALSMNYEKPSYAGTLAQYPLVLGFVIIGLSVIASRIIAWLDWGKEVIPAEQKPKMEQAASAKDICQWCDAEYSPIDKNCQKCGAQLHVSANEDSKPRDHFSSLLDRFFEVFGKVLKIGIFAFWLLAGPGLLILGIVYYFQGTTGIANMKGNDPSLGLQVVMGVILGIIGLVVTIVGFFTMRKDASK